MGLRAQFRILSSGHRGVTSAVEKMANASLSASAAGAFNMYVEPKLIKVASAMSEAEGTLNRMLTAFDDAKQYFGVAAKKAAKMGIVEFLAPFSILLSESKALYNAEEARRSKEERRRHHTMLKMTKGKGRRIAKGADPVQALSDAAKSKRTNSKGRAYRPSRSFGVRKATGVRLDV